MGRCQLTDKQKTLIRTLVPGLKDGTIQSHWTLLIGDDGLTGIFGIRGVLWQSVWHIVEEADFTDFVECGFFTLTKVDKNGANQYSLHVQRIIDAVESDFSDSNQNSTQIINIETAKDFRTVFVVHGRNEGIRRDFFSFLRALGLNPLEWEECIRRTGKASPYIGEILDTAFLEAQAVIVVMTPDDIAQLRPKYQNPKDGIHETKLTGQARPNVLFEAGMAMGRKPDRTILVEIGDLRSFSDIVGRMKINFDGTSKSRHQLAERLKTANCKVEPTGSDWLEIGDFSLAALDIDASELMSNSWGKSGNIWWLHGDLLALLNAIASRGKHSIDDYLRRTVHHSRELGLTDTYVKLESIRRATQDISEHAWTPKLREMYLGDVERILNSASQAVQSKQSGFKPDPE